MKKKGHTFQEISLKVLSNEYTVNQCITELSEVIYSVSFDLCGKTVYHNNSNKSKRKVNKLNMLGLGYLWNNAYISLNDFPIIKQRIRDMYIQQW